MNFIAIYCALSQYQVINKVCAVSRGVYYQQDRVNFAGYLICLRKKLCWLSDIFEERARR